MTDMSTIPTLYLQVLKTNPRTNAVAMHYMGAAEFEWGQIPYALAALYDAKKKGILVMGEFDAAGLSYRDAWRGNVYTINRKLYYAALPHYHNHRETQIPIDMPLILKGIIENKIRGKESFYCQEILVNRAADDLGMFGWLSICPSKRADDLTRGFHTHYNPLFIATTSPRLLKKVMQTAKDAWEHAQALKEMQHE